MLKEGEFYETVKGWAPDESADKQSRFYYLF